MNKKAIENKINELEKIAKQLNDLSIEEIEKEFPVIRDAFKDIEELKKEYLEIDPEEAKETIIGSLIKTLDAIIIALGDFISDPDSEIYYNKRTECYEIYIGSVFYLTPSRKYYTAWANSNVTDEEALMDDIYFEILEDICTDLDIEVGSSEEDPTDLVVYL